MERRYKSIPISHNRPLPYRFSVSDQQDGKTRIVWPRDSRENLVDAAYRWTRDRHGDPAGIWMTPNQLNESMLWYYCDRTDMFHFRDAADAMEFKLRWC